MTLTNLLPIPATVSRNSKTASDAIRLLALERLYKRKAAVDQLIQSLEKYQHCQPVRRAARVRLSA